MDINYFKNLLRSRGLKATTQRLQICEIFSRYNSAISYHDIEQFIVPNSDRVTLYRTLKTFEDHGIIHRISDLNGVANFALTPVGWNQIHEGLAEQHLHFCCLKCEGIFCLDSPTIPEINLPDKYKVTKLDIVITGTCNRCNK